MCLCVCVCVCVCLGTCRVWAPLSACSALCLWQHSCYKDGEGVAWPRPKRAALHLPGLQNRGCSGTQSFLHSGHAYWRSHRALLIGVGDTVIGAHVSDVGARSGILSFGSGEGVQGEKSVPREPVVLPCWRKMMFLVTESVAKKRQALEGRSAVDAGELFFVLGARSF